MQRRQGSTTRAWRGLAGWFLPFILAVAVLAMHGLGHPSGHGGRTAGMPAAHGGTPRQAAQQIPALMPAVSVPAMVRAEVTGVPEPGGLDPVAVCLAVLAGTLLLLLPLLSRRVSPPQSIDAAAAGQAGRQPSGRSPPRAPSLPALQVLRL